MPRFLPITFAVLSATVLAASCSQAQQSETLETQHVRATLLAEKGAFRPGEAITVGLLLEHDPKWHTYWKSTATGYATSLKWDLPEGFEAGPIQWPTPTVYEFMGTIEYVYEGEALLLTTIQTPESWDGSPLDIGFTADWLMCADTCIPATVEGSLEIPAATADEPLPAGPHPDLFAETRLRLPTGPGSYTLDAWREEGAVFLRLEGKVPQDLVYFDATARLRPEETATIVKSSGESRTIRLEKSAAAGALPDRLDGVLRAEGGWPALDGRTGLLVDIPLAADPPPGAVSA